MVKGILRRINFVRLKYVRRGECRPPGRSRSLASRSFRCGSSWGRTGIMWTACYEQNYKNKTRRLENHPEDLRADGGSGLLLEGWRQKLRMAHKMKCVVSGRITPKIEDDPKDLQVDCVRAWRTTQKIKEWGNESGRMTFLTQKIETDIGNGGWSRWSTVQGDGEREWRMETQKTC
jgi:hypothetical protein